MYRGFIFRAGLFPHLPLAPGGAVRPAIKQRIDVEGGMHHLFGVVRCCISHDGRAWSHHLWRGYFRARNSLRHVSAVADRDRPIADPME